MAKVALTGAAMHHLAADPKLLEWAREKAHLDVPILGYYQRSYLTSHNGDITEFGDGFMLTFDRADIDWAGQGLETATVSTANEVELLVVGPRSIFSTDFVIDWNKKKYTFSPDAAGPSFALAGLLE